MSLTRLFLSSKIRFVKSKSKKRMCRGGRDVFVAKGTINEYSVFTI